MGRLVSDASGQRTAATEGAPLLARFPLHPIAFAAYAVLFLYSANLGEVLPVDVVVPLGQALLGGGAALAICALLLRDPWRGAMVASALVVAFFWFGQGAQMARTTGLDDERGQLVVWVALLGAAALSAFFLPLRAVFSITSALNVFGLALVLIALGTIAPYEQARARTVQATARQASPIGASRQPDRDIYFLVFDRHGSRYALEHRFGIHTDLFEWLRGRGFQIAADSHANYRATDFSLASTLNMTFLDRLTSEIGRVSSDRTPARQMLQDHEVGRFLKANGYRYIHLGSWYGPTLKNDTADEVFSYGVDSEFSSVLRDTTVLPTVERLLGAREEALTFRERHREIALFQFRQLHRLASAPGRKFVFAHILLPHRPYAFRADGTPVTDAEAEAEPERDLYAGQLAYADARIKETVEALLAGPDESDPIIVVQADEGLFLCEDVDCVSDRPEDLGIRFGILNAMYLPDLDGVVYPTITPVNTFRLLFREYFGADLALLPDRSFTWPDNEHLYDFRDITDRLPASE